MMIASDQPSVSRALSGSGEKMGESPGTNAPISCMTNIMPV